MLPPAPISDPKDVAPGALDAHADWRLVCTQGGRAACPGSHVTEVMACKFTRIDREASEHAALEAARLIVEVGDGRA